MIRILLALSILHFPFPIPASTPIDFGAVASVTVGTNEVAAIDIPGLGRVWERPSPLPYDEEVAWIESSGTQYIDTGVVADSSLGVELDLEVSGSVSGNIHAPGAFQRVPSYTRHHLSRVSGKWRYMLGADGGAFFLDEAVSGRFQVKVDANAKTVRIGGSVASWSSIAPFDTRLSYWLFRRQDSDATAAEMPFAGRIYSAKLYASGTLVRDFIPVRSGAEYCLYDRVSGALFHNAGSGAFLGPN